MPFLPYMQSLDIDRHDLVQALGIMFLFIIGALTLALALQGAFDATNLVGAILAIVPTFAGVWLGQKARQAVSAETFRRICMSFDAWVVAFGLSRVLMELGLMASPWAYSVMAVTILIDLYLLYVFFSARRAASG